MITHIDNQSDVDRAVAEMQEARNLIITAHMAALHDDADEEFYYSSLKTQSTEDPNRLIEHHEALLIEWAAHKDDDHDHDAECAYEDMAEDQRQAWKDDAA